MLATKSPLETGRVRKSQLAPESAALSPSPAESTPPRAHPTSQKPDDDLQMRSILVSLVLARVRAAGLDPKVLIDRLHLPRDAEQASSITLPLSTLSAVYDAAEQLLGDPQLGIHMAQEVERGRFGVVEFSCESAPTVRSAFERLSRYHTILIDHVDIAVRDEKDLLFVEQTIAGSPLGVGRHANEFFVVHLVRRARHATGHPIVPRQAFFAHLAPKDTSALERALGTRDLSFEAGKNGFAIDSRAAAAPILTADAPLAHVLTDYADRLLPEGPPPRGLLDQVRLGIQERLADRPPSLDELAKVLHVAPRTLQRRLYDEGTSLSDLVDSVRKQLACARVLDAARTTESLAFGLGYRDTRAFLRAFKRWTGTTPGRFRGAT